MTALAQGLDAASHAVFLAAARAAQFEARRDCPDRTYIGAGHVALTEVDTAIRALNEARGELVAGLHSETVSTQQFEPTFIAPSGCVSPAATADGEPR
jgi:hypothetical protein